MAVLSETEDKDWPARRVNWVAWGNWYIKRFAHEEGWPSIFSCLMLYGNFIAASRVLTAEMPPQYRRIDWALGHLPVLLRDGVVLWYLIDRDQFGQEISIARKASALDMPRTTYEEAVRVAKFMAEKEMSRLRPIDLPSAGA